MRILILSLFVFTLALAIAALTVTRLIPNPPETKIASRTPSVLGSPSSNVVFEKYEITVNSQRLSVALIKGVDADSTNLNLNLDESITAINIFDEGLCTAVLNAGFYTPQNTPIGYFVSGYEVISNEVQSALFDGIVSINDFGTPRITRNIPRDNLRLALQSGPILIENDHLQRLAVKNDELNRRMAVATTGANEIIFIAVYDESSRFLGPNLADMPKVLDKLETVSEIDFSDAINLDGGTASALYIENFKLPEASPVGSYFCVN